MATTAFCVALVLPVFSTAAAAQPNFPARPVRIITNEPGAGLDFTARLMAQGLTQSLGQQVIVENRGGGSGVIAAELVARATPDGHTLLWHNNVIWTHPLLSPAAYQPLRDLAPVTQGTLSPNVLVVHPSVVAHSVSELLTLARAKPAMLNFSSGGAGSPTHLAAELFKSMAAINIVHIPYKGSGPALTALLGGEGHLMFTVTQGGLPHIRAGRIRALAVSSYDPEVLKANPDMQGPRLIDAASGKLVFSFHSFVVKTGKHTILIDSCIGNHKERPTRPQFHRMQSPFLADLAAIGVRPEMIDYVMCTHLHWDHVGWNTQLEDGKGGQWKPTFPNARYIMARREFEHWRTMHERGEASPHVRAFDDSVLPVVRSGQSVLVNDDYAFEDGLWFEAAPGHTPGNVVIHARSRDDHAVFLGDVIHHQFQLMQPAWSTLACTDPVLSKTTRMRLIEEYAEAGTRLLPGHFPAPTAGRIVWRGDRFRYGFE